MAFLVALLEVGAHQPVLAARLFATAQGYGFAVIALAVFALAGKAAATSDAPEQGLSLAFSDRGTVALGVARRGTQAPLPPVSADRIVSCVTQYGRSA